MAITNAGRVSPFAVTVETRGVARDFNAAALAGTVAIGAAMEIPILFTSWHVEQFALLKKIASPAATSLFCGTAIDAAMLTAKPRR